MSNFKLGILGGLGPVSSAYLYEMICEHTKASCDQDHIDIILSSRASTPDRTSFILGNSNSSPLPYMIEEAKKLETYGASALIIACNTAHYFIDEVRKSVNIPVPSIISESIAHIKNNNKKKVGILATKGTIYSKAYQNECLKYGMDFAVPDENEQNILMDLIYSSVKSGKKADINKLIKVAETLKFKGCDAIILGCTELSVINKDIPRSNNFTDSLEVIAYKAIKMSNHIPIDFPDDFN